MTRSDTENAVSFKGMKHLNTADITASYGVLRGRARVVAYRHRRPLPHARNLAVDGLAALAQLIQNNRGKAVVVAPEAVLTADLSECLLHRSNQCVSVVAVFAPSGDAQFHLSESGIGSHGGVGVLELWGYTLSKG